MASFAVKFELAAVFFIYRSIIACYLSVTEKCLYVIEDDETAVRSPFFH